MGDLQDLAGVLRQHGVQVTAQRLAALRVVANRPHATTDEIEDLVRAEIGSWPRRDSTIMIKTANKVASSAIIHFLLVFSAM